MKGIIALDIDGTAAIPGLPIAPEVISYLDKLSEQGWQLVFVTGRTYHMGIPALAKLEFPYYFIVQNGAITLEMPLKKIVNKKYLHRDIIPVMKEICESMPTDFVIYGGVEHDDVCYYRSHYFSKNLLDYLSHRGAVFNEVWIDVATFDDVELHAFPSVKCFGLKDTAEQVAQRIEERLGLHVPLIRDPFNENFYVVQATHAQVSKGFALQELKASFGNNLSIIAAGDDNNDLPMLACADVRIVMSTAPSHLLDMAHIIAPPAQEHGVITGIEQAINYLETINNKR